MARVFGGHFHVTQPHFTANTCSNMYYKNSARFANDLYVVHVVQHGNSSKNVHYILIQAINVYTSHSISQFMHQI